jgi:ABC-2 type transport system ATP-binding protein
MSESDDGIALAVDRISKTYTPLSFLGLRRAQARARATQALHDVSFAVRRGETIGLLGPNGAGKTTLLKIMTTLVHPSSGSVRLEGRDVYCQARRARSRMGLITCDERSFYWRMTGRQNLRFFATLYGVERELAESRMESLLETLDLSEAGDRPYYTYSSGMKQKLAIARGYIAEPAVLFYDEPTRSLDPVSAQRIRSWILNRRQHSPDQTHVIATNHLYEAEQLCDRVLIIDHGRLLAQGSIREICERWKVEEHETHRIVVSGWRREGRLAIDPSLGLFGIEEAENEADRLTLRVSVGRESGALSHVLKVIMDEGGTIMRCDGEDEPFDQVFCKMLARESKPAGTKLDEVLT